MRGFMILCFAAMTAAAPQGYNYQQGSGSGFTSSGVGSGFLSSGGGPGFLSSGGGSGFLSSGGGSGFLSSGGGSGFLSSGGGSGFLSSGGGSGFSSSASGTGFRFGGGAQSYEQQQPVVSKHFFIHSAPEDHDAKVVNKEIYVGTPRKNVNVVFVKSAATSAHRTNLRVIPAANEEKTVVYVLAKKDAESEVVTHVDETASQSHKPEVHFIKYNTNEEAEHAQRNIKAQYDSLGGTSDVINEGVGQVTSVVGSLGGHGAGAGFGGSTGSGSTGFSGGHGAGSGFGSTGFGTGNIVGGGSGSGSFGTGIGLAGATGHGVGLGGDAAGAAYLPPIKKQ